MKIYGAGGVEAEGSEAKNGVMFRETAIAHCKHQQIAQELVSHHILRTNYEGLQNSQSMAPT